MNAPVASLAFLGLTALMTAALCVGYPVLTPLQLGAALAGDGPGWLQTLVLNIRLPRLGAALVVGSALGLSGMLLQTLARNRLASPDVLGLNDGALLALALTLLLSPSAVLGPWWCALLGALATAGFTLVAAGGVGTQGYRVLVVGLGIASLLRAGFDIAMATLPIFHASGLYAFSVGSLAGRTGALVTTSAMVLAVLLAASLPLLRPLALLGLHDDSMRSLGLHPERLRLWVLLLAAALAGLAVSLAGPVGFVAIAAPIFARHLPGAGVAPFWGSALLGAALVIAADVAGRLLAQPAEVPAGVVTGLLGGPFLLWLLMRPGGAQ
ncbi:MAG: iron ABC transporter permease [Pseudomonadota bacterium]|nr:iron ABC transporter permease [Pseudomonadota bacterium]